ncbi:MAG: hypothetical protein MR911_10745 [Spirochaetia bacterium]|nr:hypothetical protein [Spirochaetia bacterium]
MKNLWTNKIFWEIIGYLTLALLVFGNIAVGYWYLIAESAFLIANAVSVVRDFALKLSTANIVKDIAFTGITIGLIVIYIW